MADGSPKAKGAAEPSEPDKAAYTTIKTMLFAFEGTDLYDLEDEMIQLRHAVGKLDSTSYNVDWCSLGLRDSENEMMSDLKIFLPEKDEVDRKTLYIIYYGGRSSFYKDQGLVFHRLAPRFQQCQYPSAVS